jgi:glycine C-acetyltransferase
VIDGRDTIMLGSSNYLGLANHPAVNEAARAALARYGAGFGTNPPNLTTPLHEELEAALAELCGTEAALLTNSCLAANAALIATANGAGDTICSDRLNHASIIDACRLTRATTRVYEHRRCDHLAALLAEAPSQGGRFIVTDGVFSMEGDTAPLPELVALAERFGARLAIDEAHAIGAIGTYGRGTAELHGCLGRVDYITGSLSKALGAVGGGFVAASRERIEALRAAARFYIFTSPINPMSAAAALAAVRQLRREPGLVEALWRNVRRFRAGLRARGLEVREAESPITPIMVGDTERTKALGRALLQDGVYVSAIGFPIVPRGTERLRAQPSAAHREDDIDEAVEKIARQATRLGLGAVRA